ncbi:hypothetical protein Tco_1264207 [Tanacetum coccineum]
MILNVIRNDICSTVDACPNAKEMWIAIERLQQGESINIQDVKTKLFWDFGKFTSREGESIKAYYTRFYRMMNEMVRNKFKVDNMQVNLQFLQQLQPEWNANPLALVAASQNYLDDYYQAPPEAKPYKPHAPSSRQTTSTRLNATTRNKSRKIVKAPSPPSESTSEEDSDCGY